MYGNVTFYNLYHNGDIHYSRNFVKALMSRLPAHAYLYAHKNSPRLLLDVIGLGHSTRIDCDQNEAIAFRGNDVFINTWIGQRGFKYLQVDGESILSQLAMYNDLCRTLQVRPISLSEAIPRIDYAYYPIPFAERRLREHKALKVLVANGPVHSGQAPNVDLTAAAIDLSIAHPDVLFILTEGDVSLVNVVTTRNLTCRSDCDLNEISAISRLCDIIIGRASGPFCFCHVSDNIYDPQKTFIVCSYARTSGIWCHGRATQVWTSRPSQSDLVNIIGDIIVRRKVDAPHYAGQRMRAAIRRSGSCRWSGS